MNTLAISKSAYSAILVFLLIALIVFVAVIIVRYVSKSKPKTETSKPKKFYDRNYVAKKYNLAVKDGSPKLAFVFAKIDKSRITQISSVEEFEDVMKYSYNALKDVFEKPDYVATTDDDSYCLIIHGKTEKEIKQKLTPVIKKIKNYSVLYSKNYMVKFNAGVCFADVNEDYETVLEKATKSLEFAVKQEKDFAVFNAEMMEKLEKALEFQNDLPSAFKNNEIEFYIQWAVDAKTKSVVFGEALARWNHPKEGFLIPDKFINLMKKSNYISKLDFYIFEKLCSYLETREKENKSKIKLSCNFSGQTFLSSNFFETMKGILDKYKFDHRSIIIEVTENTVFSDLELAEKVILFLNDENIAIALDNIGFGYATFTGLQKYNVSIIKLDKSLIDDSVKNFKSAKILAGLIKLGHELKMKVVCEGVETQEQLDVVIDNGCDGVQGYYFYKPMTVKEAEKVID